MHSVNSRSTKDSNMPLVRSGALVHEWIAPSGGSERVREAFTEVFPDADVHCLWNDGHDGLADANIRQSWLARTPLRRSKVASMAMMPATWRRRPGSYDWALISSHLFAHHVRFTGSEKSFIKLAYVHTPARYVWEPQLDGRGNGFAARAIAHFLKKLDRHRARELHAVASNSEFI